MTDKTPTIQPRETLQGDRLCAQCLQPLVGRTIEREPETGLLFVRCGECGTASALFEYPTATPWINRMKAVVASTLVFLILGFAIVIAASSGGFTAGAANEAGDYAGEALAAAYPGGDLTEKGTPAIGRWSTADIPWLGTPDGQAAIASSRWNVVSFLYMGLLGGLGSVIATPFMIFIAVAVSRHRPLRRALLTMVPSLLGTSCALAIVKANMLIAWRSGETWQSVAMREHLSFYLAAMWLWFNALAAIIALVGPALVAGIARLILPPSDRRLVAWLWEWRGKPVPRA
ncbi:MAG: hypothetical protein RLZZ116_1610 [Planctomycetota bacterium]|jgi:hypothetical protein